MNTNIRHKGKLFHVQTEDSGLSHPHIITHLFAEGAIVATRKTSYQEHAASANLGEIVKKLMKESHREMLIALRDGKFDGAGRSPHVEVDIPIEIDAAGPMDANVPVARASAPAMARPLGGGGSKSGPVLRPPSSPAVRRPAPASMRPPPAVLLQPGRPADTTYHVGTASAEAVVANRYAPTQPVHRLPTASPDETPAAGASIFGKEVVSEKSLDEVILSYLSEDVTEE